MDETLLLLYQTLSCGNRPDEVLALIRWVISELSDEERDQLRPRYRWRSRLALQARVSEPISLWPLFALPPLEQSCRALAEILDLPPLETAETGDMARVRALLAEARARIGMRAGQSDFKADRLNRRQRQAQGLELRRRAYNKVFRTIGRLEQDVAFVERAQMVAALSYFGRTGFAREIPWERFAASVNSAVLVAFLTSQRARISPFEHGAGAPELGHFAALLLSRCERDGADWYVVAHVLPRLDVLARVALDERLALLGRALAMLKTVGALLRTMYDTLELDRETMVAHRNGDSADWNRLAGAWNRAREFWAVLLQSLGLDDTLDHVLPGKVAPLLAADAHVDPRRARALARERAVWQELPRPWEVLEARASCTRAQILTACAHHGVDPLQTGWSVAPPPDQVERWVPEPDQVRRLELADPALALLLRSLGALPDSG